MLAVISPCKLLRKSAPASLFRTLASNPCAVLLRRHLMSGMRGAIVSTTTTGKSSLPTLSGLLLGLGRPLTSLSTSSATNPKIFPTSDSLSSSWGHTGKIECFRPLSRVGSLAFPRRHTARFFASAALRLPMERTCIWNATSILKCSVRAVRVPDLLRFVTCHQAMTCYALAADADAVLSSTAPGGRRWPARVGPYLRSRRRDTGRRRPAPRRFHQRQCSGTESHRAGGWGPFARDGYPARQPERGLRHRVKVRR